MAASKFTEERRLAIVELVRDGATLAEAAKQVDVRHKTLKDWLTRGRQSADGPYAAFAADVDEARGAAAARASELMDESEFLEHLTSRVRAGNVNAMKLWWEITHPKKDDDDDGDLGF